MRSLYKKVPGGMTKMNQLENDVGGLVTIFCQGNELGNWFYVYSGVRERNFSFNLKYT